MSADDNENGGETGTNGGGDPALERMMNEAIEHHRNNRFEQAAEGYWKVMEADPGHAQATYCLGMVMHRIGENEKAAGLVSGALVQGYGGAQEYCNLGIIYNQLGRLEDVVECQKQSIARDPQYTAAYFNLGNAYLYLSQPVGSIVSIQ